MSFSFWFGLLFVIFHISFTIAANEAHQSLLENVKKFDNYEYSDYSGTSYEDYAYSDVNITPRGRIGSFFKAMFKKIKKPIVSLLQPDLSTVVDIANMAEESVSLQENNATNTCYGNVIFISCFFLIFLHIFYNNL